MTLIRIREHKGDGETNAIVSFDHGEEYPITIADPFSDRQEQELEWYFEQHIRFPFTGQARAREAAASITAYGESLFAQIFGDPDAYARYKEALQSGVDNLAFEIAGSPDFHALHWETIKDPRLPQPLALQSPIVRRNLHPQTVRATLRPSSTVNLLIVTARPGGTHDAGYRTISRPLVEKLRQASTPVRVEILRPGTYEALVRHLEAVREQHGSGHYHVIHFDVHGALLTYQQFQSGAQAEQFLFHARYGRADIEPYDGLKAFLSLKGTKAGQSDPVEAGELAGLLVEHQIPITILSACQSGKRVGDVETSLGSRLMDAGVQLVLAMGYNVTVSAAELLMVTLYQELAVGQDLSAAIRRARLELWNRKGRRAYFDQIIDMEDWLLPVVYQNQEQRLQVQAFTPAESAAYYERQAHCYQPPDVAYGFVGRDVDILQIEKLVLAAAEGANRNIMLLRGMGGAGKTTLLHHLTGWWQATGFVQSACYFGYDERAWTRQQIMNDVARGLMGEAEYASAFQPLGAEAQQAMLAERLRAARHLLVLDNLESITGSHLTVRNTLLQDERERLHDFLRELSGGRTIILLGSRGGEEWLAPATFGDNVYDLPGLDPQSASTLANRILTQNDAAHYRDDDEVQQLLDLLDGYPRPVEVVLSNLARQTPAEVLAALQSGDETIDMHGDEKTRDKTNSILRCINYSHSNLSPDAQDLLDCLAPFTSVVWQNALGQYTERLHQQPALAHLPFDRWQEMLKQAADWGLLRHHLQVPGYLHLQPILPYFLRSRLAALGDAHTERRRAIETTFRLHYDDVGKAIAWLSNSKDAQEKQLGEILVRMEYENLVTALNLAMDAQVSILNPYSALSQYLNTTPNQRRSLEISEIVLARLDDYSPETLSGQLGAEFVSVLDNIAKRQHALKQYDTAETACKKCLYLLANSTVLGQEVTTQAQATLYGQLGTLAMEQQHWTQAEQHYQKALQFLIALDNHPGQAVTYHQLGIAAQEQRRWVQAQSYYQQALEIKIEFHNRHSQANTYHQLGCVALELGQWTQARDCFLEALNVAVDFDDEYMIDDRLHNLALVWQSSGDADLPAAVADILSIMPRQAKILLTNSLAGE